MILDSINQELLTLKEKKNYRSLHSCFMMEET